MLTPTDDQPLSSSGATVEFTGYAPTPALQVVLEAGPSPAGPFSPWPGSTVYASLLPTRIVGGLPYYRWSHLGAIPSDRFAGDCSGNATYVRPTTTAGAFTTFDDAGIDCFLNEVTSFGFFGATAMQNALTKCGAATSPVVRLSAPAGSGTYTGNVVVTSQAEADALACYTTIDGDLSILPPTTATLDLPNLAHVTGDLVLSLPADGNLPDTGPYEEVRCGQTMSWWSNISRVRLPALLDVSGDLSIDVPSDAVPTTNGERIELDLEALTQVGGDLSLTFEVPAIVPCGLSSLTQVGGDLTFVAGGQDVGLAQLWPSLTTVGGNASAGRFYSLVGSPFQALTTAGGVVTFHHHSGQVYGEVCPQLTSAAGIKLDHTNLASLEDLGTPSVTIGSLELQDNFRMLLANNVNFTPDASLLIGPGNNALTDAEICPFIDYQVTTNAWTPNGSGFSCP